MGENGEHATRRPLIDHAVDVGVNFVDALDVDVQDLHAAKLLGPDLLSQDDGWGRFYDSFSAVIFRYNERVKRRFTYEGGFGRLLVPTNSRISTMKEKNVLLWRRGLVVSCLRLPPR
jgi:hypothetical protein